MTTPRKLRKENAKHKAKRQHGPLTKAKPKGKRPSGPRDTPATFRRGARNLEQQALRRETKAKRAMAQAGKARTKETRQEHEARAKGSLAEAGKRRAKARDLRIKAYQRTGKTRRQAADRYKAGKRQSQKALEFKTRFRRAARTIARNPRGVGSDDPDLTEEDRFEMALGIISTWRDDYQNAIDDMEDPPDFPDDALYPEI